MSRGRHPSTASHADLALERFRNWPLAVRRADCPPGRALALPDRQIVHFHQDDLAEVHLTRPVIQRLRPVLDNAGRVEIPPRLGWVLLPLETERDLSLLESLVSLAIQANDSATGPFHHAVSICPQVAPRGFRR